MGGTSADASLVTGGAPVSDGGTGGGVAGIPLALPAVLIETVSAGGGSIARVDAGGALKVGPESAGAVPGPACYGRGGERPTVTDACLVLGWLDAARPLADEVRLDPGAAERRSEEHTSELQSPCNLVCRLLLEKKKKRSRNHRLEFTFQPGTPHRPSARH